MIAVIEDALFRHRGFFLAALAVFTLIAAFFCTRLTIDSEIETHLPAEHEFIQTFLDYQEELLGTDRVMVVLRARNGDIWNVAALRRLKAVTDTLAGLPHIDRRTVTSLWTPNVTYMEITEEGLHTEDIVDTGFTVDNLNDEEVARIRNRVLRGGLHGRLVSSDHTAALVVGSTTGTHPETGEKPDRLDLADRLETDLRQAFSDDAFEIHLVGVPTMMGDIAAGVTKAIMTLLPAGLALTALLLYAWTRSWRLTALPLLCSLVSLIWQLGLAGLLGYGFDPLTLVIPFLVFVIGAIHGIPQARIIAERVAAGDSTPDAARASFGRLLLPDSLALLVTAAALLAMTLIPVHTVRAAGITAAFGVVAKIASNVVMLPVLASYGSFGAGVAEISSRARQLGTRTAGLFGAFAGRYLAVVTVIAGCTLLAVSAWQIRDRQLGDEHPGAGELTPDSRYNRDARLFTERFDLRMDLLLLIAEVPKDACIDYEVIDYIDRLTWHMQNVTGVHSVMSATPVARYLSAMWNEGNPKWTGIPRNRYALMQVMSSIPAALGVFNNDCSVMQVQVFTDDHGERTVRAVADAARGFRDNNPSEKVRLRLASGGLAVQAANNEVLADVEQPMLLWPLAAIVILALFAWRDWRAALACTAPHVLATALGYAFMARSGIGVTTSALPILVLGIGMGSTFSFYLWDNLRRGLTRGIDLAESWRDALQRCGGGVVCMALALTLTSAIWWFSSITAQAEAGRLLALLIPLHALLSLTLLPAMATVTGTGPESTGNPAR
jgi:predicted RND superfamily exporter protein